MGYESRLYVVNKSDSKHPDGKVWAESIAMFDLCKVGGFYPNMDKYPDTDCFIFGPDGNTRITEDNYGDPLKEIPIEDTIKMIEECMRESPDYRRWAPCLGLLKGFDKEQWSNLVVLHYGH